MRKIFSYSNLALICLLLVSGCAHTQATTNAEIEKLEFVQNPAEDDDSDDALVSTPPPSESSKVVAKNAKRDKPGKKELGRDHKLAKSLTEVEQLYTNAIQAWEKGKADDANKMVDTALTRLLALDLAKRKDLDDRKMNLRTNLAKLILTMRSYARPAILGSSNEIPLIQNKYVEREIRRFQENHDANVFFANSFRRSARYRARIEKRLREEGIPAEIAWLPLIESGFNPKAYSPAAAAGMWQFIASTGYNYGLKRDIWVDDRLDPEKSTEAAILYLKDLHEMFGDWLTALAAYNCGEYRVLNTIKRQQSQYLDSFWDLFEELPQETRDYVPRFIATLMIVQDPVKYGFNVEQGETTEYDTIEVAKLVSLASLERQANLSADSLVDLNPALKRGLTPPTPHKLRIPKGSGDVIVTAISDLPTWNPPPSRHERTRETVTGSDKTQTRYVVKSGDSLQKIAKKYRTSVKTIKKLNNLRSDRLKAGQVLKINGQIKEDKNKGNVNAKERKGKKKTLTSYDFQGGKASYATVATLRP
jgi:membrane-bound lytic murein transglycosylase D